MRLAILLLLLVGCAKPQCYVTLMSLEEVRAPQNCGADVLPNYGCWKSTGQVIAEDARDTGDTVRLRTIGEEAWKCFHSDRSY